MRWDDFRRSDNVEDAGSGGGFGFGGGFRLGGGAIIAVVVISLLLGKNPLDVLTLLETGAPPPTQAPARSAPPGGTAQNVPQRDFVRAVLDDTEVFWSAELARSCVPTALPASGDIRRGNAARSTPATSSRDWLRRHRSATTGCSSRREGLRCRSRSRTAHRRSACAGSASASRPAICASAIRSP